MGNESPLTSMLKATNCQSLTEAREAYLSILEKGKQFGVARGNACRACAPVRKRHTFHCRVGYSGCNRGGYSAKTKCEPELCAKTVVIEQVL